MSQVTEEGENVFEQLTSMAMEAATQGKWDAVAQFYDRRARAGSLDTNVPSGCCQETHAVRSMDHDSHSRSTSPHTATAWRSCNSHRRRLEGLKRQWAGQDTGSSPTSPEHLMPSIFQITQFDEKISFPSLFFIIPIISRQLNPIRRLILSNN